RFRPTLAIGYNSATPRSPSRMVLRLARIGLLVLIGLRPLGVHAQTPVTPFHTFETTSNSLVPSVDGNMYGLSGDTFFRLTPDGGFTVLRSSVQGSLLVGKDGNLYGTQALGFDFFTRTFSTKFFKVGRDGTLTSFPTVAGFQSASFAVLA